MVLFEQKGMSREGESKNQSEDRNSMFHRQNLQDKIKFIVLGDFRKLRRLMQQQKIKILSQFTQTSRDSETKVNEQLEIRDTIENLKVKNPRNEPTPGSLAPVQIQNCQKVFSSLHSIQNVQNCTLTPRQPHIKCYINKPTQTFCSECGQHTETLQRQKVGQTVYLWSMFLLFTTGVCCVAPFLMERCKDKQLICIRCCSKKGVKFAQCCSCQ